MWAGGCLSPSLPRSPRSPSLPLIFPHSLFSLLSLSLCLSLSFSLCLSLPPSPCQRVAALQFPEATGMKQQHGPRDAIAATHSQKPRAPSPRQPSSAAAERPRDLRARTEGTRLEVNLICSSATGAAPNTSRTHTHPNPQPRALHAPAASRTTPAAAAQRATEFMRSVELRRPQGEEIFVPEDSSIISSI